MARTISKCPGLPITGAKDGHVVSRRYTIYLITPLFGGGVEPGKNDPVTLIRGSSIRGQLRFWWRASRGAREKTIEDLKKHEEEIWGTVEKPSSVIIGISAVQRGKQVKWAEYQLAMGDREYKSIPTPNPMFRNVTYALFPFQGKRGNRGREVVEQPATATLTASFQLTIKWPVDLDIGDDVEAAMWGWVNFGGLGARARRGCGALFCRELAPDKPNDIAQWYLSCLEKYKIDLPDKPREWPTLPEKILVQDRGVPLSAMEAWSNAIRLLGDFRQGIGVGRNESTPPGRPGRSRWPEADGVRRITGQSAIGHETSTTTQENAFPRAEFGLPIIFHFKDKGKGEPSDHGLFPKGKERMASPLVLKPLALDVDKALAMVMGLKTIPVEEVELQSEHGEPLVFAEKNIRRPDLATYPKSPMDSRTASGSALEAFMNFAQERGFK